MLGSSILVSLATLLVNAISFLSQVVLAWKFGATSSMDIYLVGVSAPMFVSGLLTAALSYSLVPALVLRQSSACSFNRFNGSLCLSFLIIAVSISLAGLILSPVQLDILGHKFSNEERIQALAVARVSWITAALILMVAYLRGLQNANSKFLLASFTGLIPPLCVVVAGIAFVDACGLISIAWAMFIGLVIVAVVLVKKSAIRINNESLYLINDPDVKSYFRHLPFVALSMLSFTAFQMVDSYWAPFIGPGTISYLAYSQRLVVSIGNIVIAGPSAVILPSLSKAYADGHTDHILAIASRLLRMVLACSLPVAIFTTIFAEEIIILLFERGAFTRTDSVNLSALMPYMMTGMVPMLCVVILYRVLYAMQDFFPAYVIGILTISLYFVLSGVFQIDFKAFGIAFAYASTWWIIFVGNVYALFRKNISMIATAENISFLKRISIVSLAIICLTLVGRYIATELNILADRIGIYLSIFWLAYLLLYTFLTTKLIPIKEIQILTAYIFNKIIR
jgi:putative peptidoglycan lipid II flippase